MTRSAKKQILNIGFLVLLIAATVIILFVSQDIDINDTWSFIGMSDPWFMFGAFMGLVGYILFEAISLHIIAHRMGHKSKFVSSIAYTTSDLYYSAITPSASGGQPASAFYMMRDGMSGGAAGFTVLMNIIGYTIATILVGLFALCVCPWMMGDMRQWFALFIVIVGFVVQFLLLALLLICMFRARLMRSIGAFGINFLAKIKIIKKRDKWIDKLDGVINKYRSCRGVLKKHPMLFLFVALLNIAQRVSQTIIPCFVIMAVRPDASFLELFCMQSYVMIGYNAVPLPGGTGAYEYLYPNIFGVAGYEMNFVFSAMMVSRFISYYILMIVCGLITLVYHAVGLKKHKQTDGEAPKVPADGPADFDIMSALGDVIEKEDEPQTDGKARPPSDKPNDGSDPPGEDESFGQAADPPGEEQISPQAEQSDGETQAQSAQQNEPEGEQ